MAAPSRHAFVESMKALGMALIVYGHVAHATTVPLTPPIYLKQLGVAFFLFVSAFTLARERRAPAAAVARRLLPVYGYGIGLALVLTALGAGTGTGLALSNFLPFAAGVNVLRDSFPANPTTWYVGTYVHFMVLWALCLRHVTVRGWMIPAAMAAEIPVRALLLSNAGPYVAYMLFTNWTAVFLLGLYHGQRVVNPGKTGVRTPLLWGAVLAAGLVASAAVFRRIGVVPTFPFMTVAGVTGSISALIVSAGTSTIYLAATSCVFGAVRSLDVPGVVRFVSRNSLVIFLAHMPVYLALAPILTGWGFTYWPRVAIQLAICLVGLALVSEAIRWVLGSRPVRIPLMAMRASLEGVSTS